MPSIPKTAFRIWYGSDLSPAYRQSLLDLKKHHPDYAIKLFTHSSSMSALDYASLHGFCEKSDIRLVDIDIDDSPHTALVKNELNKAIATQDLAIKKIHYARASDLTRMIELYRNGGIYTDTDMDVIGTFGEIDSESSVIFAAYSQPDLWYQSVPNTYQYHVKGVAYDFIAAQKGHPVFLHALAIHDLDINTQAKFKDFSLSDYDRDGLRRYVIETTGGLLYHAINYAIQDGTITNVPALFYETAHCLKRKLDNSWLSTHDAKIDKKAIERLDKLVEHIQSGRFREFPIENIGLKFEDYTPPKRVRQVQKDEVCSNVALYSAETTPPHPQLFFTHNTVPIIYHPPETARPTANHSNAP